MTGTGRDPLLLGRHGGRGHRGGGGDPDHRARPDPGRRPGQRGGDGRPQARGVLLLWIIHAVFAHPPGSVDDGKSTLIGRLLYDSKSIFSDQLEAVERTSRDRGEDYTNLALLTDGLRAEREQGITIDVAYRYFATPRRKFIIADTPGHIQYTRNMVPARPRPTSRWCWSTPATGSPSSAAARVPGHLAAGAAHGARGEQDGPRRLQGRGVRPNLQESLRLRRAAGYRRPDLHPDVRTARRQRGGPVGQHDLVRRALAAAPPGTRAHRVGP